MSPEDAGEFQSPLTGRGLLREDDSVPAVPISVEGLEVRVGAANGGDRLLRIRDEIAATEKR